MRSYSIKHQYGPVSMPDLIGALQKLEEPLTLYLMNGRVGGIQLGPNDRHDLGRLLGAYAYQHRSGVRAVTIEPSRLESNIANESAAKERATTEIYHETPEERDWRLTF